MWTLVIFFTAYAMNGGVAVTHVDGFLDVSVCTAAGREVSSANSNARTVCIKVREGR